MNKPQRAILPIAPKPPVVRPADVVPATVDDTANIALNDITPRAANARPANAFQVTEYRRRRRWGAPFAFLLMVLLPTIAAGYYYLYKATPQYVSEFQFGVRSADAARNDATAIFQGMAAASQIGLDSYMIVEFVKSREMVDHLSSVMDFDTMFNGEHVDPLSRLDPKASIEDKVEYWRKHVEPYFDLTTGAIYVKVRAFKPEDSRKLSEVILERATKLVNETSQQIRNDALRTATSEVQTAEDRLKQAVAAVQTFRNSSSSINPTREAEAGLQSTQTLKDEITKARAQLAVQKSYLSNRSPAVVATERRITALTTQLESVQKTLTNEQQAGTPDPALSQNIGTFDTLALEQRFAEEYYSSSLATLNRAKLTADQQVAYLAVFVRPTLPGSSTYPDPLQSILIAFAICFGIWILGFILVTSIREK